MIADARAVASRWPRERARVLAELAVGVTEVPWLPVKTHGLAEDEIVHAIALSAYFGHLNRIADAVAVPLDYTVRHEPPHAEPATPALRPAPHVRAATFDLSRRPTTAQAIAAWRAYVFERDAPLASRTRAMLAARVGALLGHAVDGPPPATLDGHLLALAELVTLAPWQLGDRAFAALREAGFDDAALFDACVVASTAGMVSRIAVALAALES